MSARCLWFAFGLGPAGGFLLHAESALLTSMTATDGHIQSWLWRLSQRLAVLKRILTGVESRLNRLEVENVCFTRYGHNVHTEALKYILFSNTGPSELASSRAPPSWLSYDGLPSTTWHLLLV